MRLDPVKVFGTSNFADPPTIETDQWEQVLEEMLGLRVLLNEDLEGLGGGAWTANLQAVKDDLWFSEGFTIFKSKQGITAVAETVTILVQPVATDDKTLEAIMESVLRDAAWESLSALILLFASINLGGMVGRLLSRAIRQAVKLKKWTHFILLAEFGEKGASFLETHPNVILEAVGLRTEGGRYPTRAKRVDIIQGLMDGPEACARLVEVLIRCLVWSCCVGMDGNRWVVPLETLDDFRMHSKVTCRDLLGILKTLPQNRVINSMRPFRRYALDSPLVCFTEHMIWAGQLTIEELNRALLIALEAKDSYLYIITMERGADATQFVEGQTTLQIALTAFSRYRSFKIFPDQLVDYEVNAKNAYGKTVLHSAIAFWLQRPTGRIFLENVKRLLRHGADIGVPFPDGETVLQKVCGATGRRRSRLLLVLLLRLGTASKRGGKAVDWSPAPGSGWNALHVLCREGEARHAPRLVELKADPVEHRRGLTLIDTTLTSPFLTPLLRVEGIDVLCQIPGLVKDHVDTVQRREREISLTDEASSSPSPSSSPSSRVKRFRSEEVEIDRPVSTTEDYAYTKDALPFDYQYKFPLMCLIDQLSRDQSNLDVIKCLHRHNALAPKEILEARDRVLSNVNIIPDKLQHAILPLLK